MKDHALSTTTEVNDETQENVLKQIHLCFNTNKLNQFNSRLIELIYNLFQTNSRNSYISTANNIILKATTSNINSKTLHKFW